MAIEEDDLVDITEKDLRLINMKITDEEIKLVMKLREIEEKFAIGLLNKSPSGEVVITRSWTSGPARSSQVIFLQVQRP